MSEIRVKVADYAVDQGPAVIATIGLGSCVAITLYDASTRIGGLAHILLPNELMSRDVSNHAKFPATAVPLLLDTMRTRGSTGVVTAKIVGGASMFASLLPISGINIGERNVAATREALELARIPLMAHDIGGDYGRSVYLHLNDGRVFVRSLKMGDRVL